MSQCKYFLWTSEDTFQSQVLILTPRSISATVSHVLPSFLNFQSNNQELSFTNKNTDSLQSVLDTVKLVSLKIAVTGGKKQKTPPESAENADCQGLTNDNWICSLSDINCQISNAYNHNSCLSQYTAKQLTRQKSSTLVRVRKVPPFCLLAVSRKRSLITLV